MLVFLSNKNRQSCGSACVLQVLLCFWIVCHNHCIGADGRSCELPKKTISCVNRGRSKSFSRTVYHGHKNDVRNVCIVFRMSINYSTYLGSVSRRDTDSSTRPRAQSSSQWEIRVVHPLKWRNAPHSHVKKLTGVSIPPRMVHFGWAPGCIN